MRILGGRYQLEECIGAGGMSEVWRGYDEVLARPVAVKLLSGRRTAGPGYADLDHSDQGRDERARTEARAAARLAHPNVAGVYDFGMARLPQGGRAPYIVMELVHGSTLADHLAAGPMQWDIAVRVCAEVSAALAAAHSHRIVHRDIKPANIMLTPSGVKVLDFGIATAAGQPDHVPDGFVVGTPAYLAPERLGGEPATPATDMYSVGVLLYQCLTGRLPWPAETPTQLMCVQRARPPDPLPAIDGLATEAADLCARCLSRDPEERPTSPLAALVLAEAVDARVYVPPIEVPPIEGPPIEVPPLEVPPIDGPAGSPSPAGAAPDAAPGAAPRGGASGAARDGRQPHIGKHRTPTGPVQWASAPTDASGPSRRRTG